MKSRMKHWKFLGIALLALVPMTLNLTGCAIEDGGSEVESDASGILGLAGSAGYVGSTFCQTCHPDNYNSWLNSQHNKKINTLTEAHAPGIIADSDSDGTNDFSHGIVIGDPADPNPNNSGDFLAMNTAGVPPTLGEAGGVPTVTIGPITYNVDFTLGGKWKQRYVTIIGSDWYILPLQYNPVPNKWTIYHGENWYDFIDGDADNAYDVGEVITGPFYNLGETPLTNARTTDSWQRRCVGCHVTGLTGVTEDPSGEIIADFSERNVACEACHGPALFHVSQGGGLGSILNPAKVSDFEAGNICGRCHTRGDSKFKIAGKSVGWPWPADGNPYSISDPIQDHYDLTTAGSKLWKDAAGTAKGHHQQQMEFENSAHYKAGIRCFDCHDPHGSSFPSSTRLDPDTNELCLSCHGGSGPGPVPPGATLTGGVVTDIQGHTDNGNFYHPVDPTDNTRPSATGASKCTGCHMPFTAKSSYNYDIRSHSFKFLYPAEEVVENVLNGGNAIDGRPYGCNSSATDCHGASGGAPLKWASALASVQDYIAYDGTDSRETTKPKATGHKTTAVVSLASGSTVTLDGSGSFHPYDDGRRGRGATVLSYSYSWVQASGPAVTLSSSTAAAPTFTAALPGTYSFQLTVTAGLACSGRGCTPISIVGDPVTVTVTVTQ